MISTALRFLRYRKALGAEQAWRLSRTPTHVGRDRPDPDYPPTFVVTGFMRSGTSMMMRALFEGMGRRVELVTSDERVAKLNAGDYIPNHEYLEPRLKDFETPEFPRMHEGKLLKCLMAGMHPLWPMRGGLHVVQMWRDPRIILESWTAASATMGKPVDWLPDGYMVRAAACSAMLRNRRDVISHTDVLFPELVADPFPWFRRLRAAGWPITDVDAACEVVEPTKMRMADAVGAA